MGPITRMASLSRVCGSSGADYIRSTIASGGSDPRQDWGESRNTMPLLTKNLYHSRTKGKIAAYNDHVLRIARRSLPVLFHRSTVSGNGPCVISDRKYPIAQGLLCSSRKWTDFIISTFVCCLIWQHFRA